MKLFLLVVLIFILTIEVLNIDNQQTSVLHVWNVGQGQWLTFSTSNRCEHYDMGGEKAPWQKIFPLCQKKKNILFVSHWDWDHMSFVQKFSKKVVDLCLQELPLGSTSPNKLGILTAIPLCGQTQDFNAEKIYDGSHFIHSSTNDRSRVLVSSGFLIPGDSTKKEERLWFLSRKIVPAKVLILGHHGSKTSSSELLLSHLPWLKTAVATARKKKYGHPHPEIVSRLKSWKIPLLPTEEWGNLHFILN